MSIEAIEKTPSLEVLKLVEKINENFETAKEMVEKAYTLLIRDNWEPKEAKKYLYENINLQQRTIRKYLPLEAKDISKIREQNEKEKVVNITTSDEKFADHDPQKTEEDKPKVVNISKGHKVVDIEPVTDTSQTTDAVLERVREEWNLSTFKNVADDVNIIYFEDKTKDQIRAALADLRFGNKDKFDCMFQRKVN